MASKKESTFINMVLVLFIVTFIASGALGLLNEATKAPIAASKLAKQTLAITTVVPAFDNSPTDESFTVEIDGGVLEFFPAKANGELVGTAVKTFTKDGFSGIIDLMVGFLPDGSINNIAVLYHEETPGLGDKMQKSKSEWSVQFNGKNPGDFKMIVKQDGGEVDAITASTITSRAFCDAVQRAYDAYMNTKQGGE